MGNETVQLEKFVSSALIQIVNATQIAGIALKDTGAVVVPRVMGGPSTAAIAGHMRSARRIPVTLVEFDVAVTATQGDETEAGVGVVAGFFNVGVRGKEQKDESMVSRISFSVPIELPSTDPEKHDPCK